MPTRLNRESYEKLIAEDITWIMRQERTLERDHVLAIVIESPENEYGARASDIDPKTKQLIEEAETLVGSIHGPFLHDSIEESDIDFLENAPAKMIELCSAIREQDKRARHAEQERDAFDKRIAELETQLQERTVASAAWDALAINRLRIINEQSSRIRDLEAQLKTAKEGAQRAHDQRMADLAIDDD